MCVGPTVNSMLGVPEVAALSCQRYYGQTVAQELIIKEICHGLGQTGHLAVLQYACPEYRSPGEGERRSIYI